MSYSKVENKEHLVRDSETNAIINTDLHAFEAYKVEYRKKLQENRNMTNMEEELKSLKSDIDEIKSLLRNLANDGSK